MTIKEWLDNLVTSDSTTMEDSANFQALLRNMTDFKRAVVVYGVVYLEGQGRPLSIQSVAKELLNAVKQEVKQ